MPNKILSSISHRRLKGLLRTLSRGSFIQNRYIWIHFKWFQLTTHNLSPIILPAQKSRSVSIHFARCVEGHTIQERSAWHRNKSWNWCREIWRTVKWGKKHLRSLVTCFHWNSFWSILPPLQRSLDGWRKRQRMYNSFKKVQNRYYFCR